MIPNDLTRMEKRVYEAIIAGPSTGLTSDEIAIATNRPYDSVRNHGTNLLKRRGLIVPIGSRPAKPENPRSKQTVWLDAERAGVNAAPHDRLEEKENKPNGHFLISTRLALTEYIKKTIAEDGGIADPSWIARCIVRDWNIKPRT